MLLFFAAAVHTAVAESTTVNSAARGIAGTRAAHECCLLLRKISLSLVTVMIFILFLMKLQGEEATDCCLKRVLTHLVVPWVIREWLFASNPEKVETSAFLAPIVHLRWIRESIFWKNIFLIHLQFKGFSVWLFILTYADLDIHIYFSIYCYSLIRSSILEVSWLNCSNFLAVWLCSTNWYSQSRHFLLRPH